MEVDHQQAGGFGAAVVGYVRDAAIVEEAVTRSEVEGIFADLVVEFAGKYIFVFVGVRGHLLADRAGFDFQDGGAQGEVLPLPFQQARIIEAARGQFPFQGLDRKSVV